MRTLIIVLGCFFTFCSVSRLVGQTDEQPDTLLQQSIEEVTVVSTRLASSIWSTARSVYRSDLKQSNQGNQNIALDESLQHIPGVFALNPLNFSQDLRISIRGFGSRAAFGIRGVKVFVDGIPATTPDGQTQLDHLDMQQMGALEVLNGASAGLYGNASGGVISLRRKSIDHDQVSLSLRAGSFGMLRSNIDVHQVEGSLYYGGGLGFNKIDGYRAHSGARSIKGYGYVGAKKETSSWKLALSYTDSPKAQDPGGINAAAVEADRTQARDRNVLYASGEVIKRGMASFQYEKILSSQSSLSARTYFIHRDFSAKLPFTGGGGVAFNRNFGGANVQYKWSGGSYKLLAGLDVEKQADDRIRHDNLEGTLGATTLDQRESFNMVGLYLLQEWQPVDRLQLELTTRLDLIGIEAEDHFLTNGNQSGDTQWQHFSPSLGINYQVHTSTYIFGRVGHSFETPALSELSNNPDGSGGFNLDLLPQQALHYEIGLKGWAGNSLQYQLAGFYIDLDHELLPFELEAFPGRSFYRNAGSSSRAGIELSLEGAISPTWHWQTAYTYSDFTFRDYVVDGTSLEGNQLPGIPKHFGSVGVRYGAGVGFYFNADVRFTGALYTDDGNETEDKGYMVVHPRLGWNFDFEASSLNIHFGLRNATNTKYNDNIRINAFGGRYFEPAPGTHFFMGAEYQF